jgi:hypothetical protein
LSDGTYDNCTVTVTDSAGNAGNTIKLTSFTIETVAPTVSSTYPIDGANTVISSISATFSELMDNSTISNSTFTLKDASNNSVSGNVTLSSSSSNTTATFIPSNSLTSLTQFTASLATEIKDLYGNALTSDNRTWSFTLPWTQHITNNISSWGSVYARDIAIDSSGNIFVVGYCNNGLFNSSGLGNTDAFLVKYNSSGLKQWSKIFGTSEEDKAVGIALDNNSNAYITGYTKGDLGASNSGREDFFVAKYNSSGTHQWTKQIGSQYRDAGLDVKVGSSGAIYIVGTTTSDFDGNSNAGTSCAGCDSGHDIIMLKYDASGNKTWSKQIGLSDRELASGLTLDSSENLYVAGYSNTPSIGTDASGVQSAHGMFLAKYNSSGDQSWAVRFDAVQECSGCSADFQHNEVALDSSGNIYIIGQTNSSFEGETNLNYHDAFLIKTNSSGVKQWAKQFGGTGVDGGRGITIDSNDNIYVTGYASSVMDPSLTSVSGSHAVFVQKYDTSGNVGWTKQIFTSASDYPEAIANDSSGNVYVVGSSPCELDGAKSSYPECDNMLGINRGFILKYDSSGTKQ